jgi:uncharacterized delta-60 repeat protein
MSILTFLCLSLLAPCTARAACEPNIPADFNEDCRVNFYDYDMMALDWQKLPDAHEWVAIYHSADYTHDIPKAIAVDSNDNIYVTGVGGHNVDSNANGDYLTIKYSSDSNQPVWIARYNGPSDDTDVAQAIAVDSNDNIYVTGYSYVPSGADYLTIKYSPDSNLPVWVARYNGPGDREDRAYAVATDSNDNIYVTGYSNKGSGTNYDYATVKYSPDSNLPVWVARYSGPGNNPDRAWAIAVDSNDNIYVTGDSTGSGTGLDYATVKYSPSSNQPIWAARYNGPDNGDDLGYVLAVDSNDNIYVTGYSTGSATDRDYVTIKYAPDSEQPVWVARYNGPGNSADQPYHSALAVDSNDNIYVTGGSFGSGTGEDYATIKYPPDSNEPVWVARHSGTGDGNDRAWAIATDSNDNIYVTGICYRPYYHFFYTYRDVYTTIKYSPDSNQPVWVAGYRSSWHPNHSPEAIAVDSNDNIYATCYIEDLGANYATVKYTPEYTCTPQIIGDFDQNCIVDIYDLEVFCRYWLDCNLDPPEDCWQ